MRLKAREPAPGCPEATNDEMLRQRSPYRSPIAILAIAVLWLSPAERLAASTPRSSLLLLIDTSGSMDSEIGNGNPDIKIEAAKQAASGALRQAAQKGNVEVAVLAFEGDCARPVSRSVGFTTDFSELERFVASLQPGGGTPMAAAVLFANRFMQSKKSRTAQDHMIVLLADGQNDCGSVTDALADLKSSGVIFRHETIGFGIEPDSSAARDLQNIATASGGTYHHAANAIQLGDLFMKFVDTSTVIDLLGTFGRRSVATTTTPRTQPATPTQPRPSEPPPAQVTDLLGAFGSANTAAAEPADAPAPLLAPAACPAEATRSVWRAEGRYSSRDEGVAQSLACTRAKNNLNDHSKMEGCGSWYRGNCHKEVSSAPNPHDPNIPDSACTCAKLDPFNYDDYTWVCTIHWSCAEPHD